MAEDFAKWEVASQTELLSDATANLETEATVVDIAVALYQLARKAVFLLVLNKQLSPVEGLRRFSEIIGKDAALFGEDMQRTDEEDDADEETESDESDQEDGDNGDQAGGQEVLRPCAIHPGQHDATCTGTVDFTVIERYLIGGLGYELPNGTLVLTHDPTRGTLDPRLSRLPYYMPPPDRI